MTFQNLLSTIPNWNPITIEAERKRIEETSGDVTDFTKHRNESSFPLDASNLPGFYRSFHG